MLIKKSLSTATLMLAATVVLPAAAQVKPTPPSDPLARIRAAAAANAEVCTVAPTSPCAQANPKIIAAAQSSTTLDANLRKLLRSDIGARDNGSAELTKAIAWAVAGFKAAGVDDVHTEKYMAPAAWTRAGHVERQGENVVAEIRGREKPDEYIVLSSHVDSDPFGHGALDAGCNAALVIEAARAIHLTGLRPRRSIRFILFTGSVPGEGNRESPDVWFEWRDDGNLGSWAYAQAHRDELDHIVAAVNFDRGTGRVDGFSLGGRPELQSGVREVLKDFDSSWKIARYTNDATFDSDNFDFLLEGIPTLLANQDDAGYAAIRRTSADTYARIDLDSLKHNTAVAGVLIFGLAEHEAPLGPRLSRADIEALLTRTGLARSMGGSRSTLSQPGTLWKFWQDGSRGRQP